MKCIIGLLAICFCLMLSVNVGAVEQPIKTEFVCQDAPVFCDVLVLDFAVRPVFSEATVPVPYGQPGESHGNPERLCGILGNTYAKPVHGINKRLNSDGSIYIAYCFTCAFEPIKITNSDWKVGWQALNS